MENNESSKSILIRLGVFIKERFPLAAQLPLIAVFSVSNAAAANAFGGGETASLFSSPSFWISALVILLVFLHLRIFDEIKDYETDLRVHPERPLARGLLSLKETKVFAAAVCVIEAALVAVQCASFGLSPAFLYAAVLLFSVLMYKEFFIPKLLSKNILVYALSHAPVSYLMGLYIFSSVFKGAFPNPPAALLLFGISNFALSMIFEVSRKSFAPAEEQKERDSYTKSFGLLPSASVLLSFMGTSIAASLMLGYALEFSMIYFRVFYALGAYAFLICLSFVLSPTKTGQNIFQGGAAVFVLLQSAAVIFGATLWN